MPCAACGRRKGVNFSSESLTLNQPLTTIWGPALWRILHAAAEKAGRNPIPVLQVDEVRSLELLVRSFPATLPCPTCQKHSSDYLRAHPLTWVSLKGPDATPVIRRWFFDFHNHVSGAKDPPAAAFTYEDVESTYAPVECVEEQVTIVLRQLTLAINHNWVKHDAATKFKRHLGTLRALINI
jgi:hypothetical protein